MGRWLLCKTRMVLSTRACRNFFPYVRNLLRTLPKKKYAVHPFLRSFWWIDNNYMRRKKCLFSYILLQIVKNCFLLWNNESVLRKAILQQKMLSPLIYNHLKPKRAIFKLQIGLIHSNKTELFWRLEIASMWMHVDNM